MGPDLEIWEGIVRLVLALGLAGTIGLEREVHEQEAGLRTHILVGMGACLFVLVGNYAWEDLRFGSGAGVTLDPSRVIAYVVTGIGFLGAGAILKHGVNVRGLTTAASLWVTAAVGATAASGEYVWAITATAIVLISLWPLAKLASAIGVRRRGAVRLQVELSGDASVAAVAAALEERGVTLESARVTEEPDLRRVDLVVEAGRGSPLELLDAIRTVEGVRLASLAD